MMDFLLDMIEVAEERAVQAEALHLLVEYVLGSAPSGNKAVRPLSELVDMLLATTLSANAEIIKLRADYARASSSVTHDESEPVESEPVTGPDLTPEEEDVMPQASVEPVPTESDNEFLSEDDALNSLEAENDVLNQHND